MSKTIIDLWYGHIIPFEECGANDPAILELHRLMTRHSDTLRKELTEVQTESFQKFIESNDDYMIRMTELAFQQGFTIGCKLTAEALL